MNSLKEMWAGVLELLADKLTSTAIKTWFSDCEPIEMKDGQLVLATTAPFKRDILNQRFSGDIKAVLKELLASDFEVLILTQEEAADYKDQQAAEGTLPEMDGYTFENFIVGNSNKFAHGAALGVVKNPGRKAYNPLFIYGNSGLGKTHLLCAIGSAIHENSPKAQIVYVKGDEFLNDLVQALKDGTVADFRQKYRYADLFLVDDIQFIAGKERSQEEFFHTFNSIYEAGNQIVLTSDRPPMEMNLLDDRLRTRFEGGLMADIQPPDLETRMAITRDKAGHLAMTLSNEIIQYIAEEITSNVRQIEGVVKKLTALHEISGSAITKEQAEKAIAEVKRTGVYIPTPDEIIEETARYYQISAEDIKGQRRNKNIALARHVSVYMTRTLCNISLEEVGKYYSNRDHTTMMASVRNIEKRLKTDKEIDATIRDITSNLNSRHI